MGDIIGIFAGTMIFCHGRWDLRVGPKMGSPVFVLRWLENQGPFHGCDVQASHGSHGNDGQRVPISWFSAGSWASSRREVSI